MKALILWAEPASKNLGVRALSEGTASLLRRALPGVELSFQGFGPGDAPVRIGSPRKQALRALAPRTELLDWVRGFDLVVDTGAGDSFADIYGLRRLLTMSLMGEIVGRAGVPLVLGPQTIGPFETRRGRVLARRTLRRSALVMARDVQSATEAERVGRPADLLTTDVVFALDSVARTGGRDVVVNPSGLLWHPNPHVDFQRYRSTVRELCTELVRQGRELSFIAHVLDSPLVDNDVPVVTELATEFSAERLVPTDLSDVRRMLASAHLIVGSRMHACLNALSVGTPAIPLAYSRKFEPLLAALGWNHTVDVRTGDDHVEQALAAVHAPALDENARSVKARAEQRLVEAERALRDVV